MQKVVHHKGGQNMKAKRKIVTTYICKTCKTAYSSKKACEACEKLPVEAAVAKVGDKVTILEQRECLMSNKHYIARGVISGVSGALPPDTEYELKWLGGRPDRLNTHVRSYGVAYKCPRCGEKREHFVFAPEFVVQKNGSAKKSEKNHATGIKH